MEDIILYNKKTHSLNTLNGVLNENNLQFAKRTMLFDAIREHTDLIKTKQHYPENDISDVDMELDCVVMSRYKYNKMLKVLSNLPEERQNTIEKYLNFPKLKV